MNRIKFYIAILSFLLILSCQKQEIEPLGFYEVNYYTNSNETQTFNYYFDDGEFVANGLQQPLITIKSDIGTFSTEQLLLLNFRTDKGSLPDSVYPFSYMFNLSYKDSILKPLEYNIHFNYPFNNPAHTNYDEQQFFLQNLQKMKLVKIKYLGSPDLYFNPEFTLETIPFEIDPSAGLVSFNSKDIESWYALCWIENKWSDTISLNFGGNSNIGIFEGYRTTPQNPEGATFSASNLALNYTSLSQISSYSSNDQRWQFHEGHIVIKNPQQGSVDLNNIDFSILLKKPNSIDWDYTHLKLHSTSNVNIDIWPDVNEWGTLSVTGLAYAESEQTTKPINMSIRFKRQR